MDEYVTVQVSVPRDRLGAFHEFFGRWLQESSDRQPVVNDGDTRQGASEIPWRPWTEGTGDGPLRNAQYVYSRVSPNARRMLDYWVEHPGTPVTGQTLAQELDLSGPHVVPGTLSSVGKWSKEVRRHHPFVWEWQPGGGSYWMEPDVADLFRRAREAAGK